MAIHKGTELNNVKETWQQNEQTRQGSSGIERVSNEPTGLPADLEQAIKEEAAEYDRANKEERLLDGERATVRDDEGGT
jgi:hypothetical protein